MRSSRSVSVAGRAGHREAGHAVAGPRASDVSGSVWAQRERIDRGIEITISQFDPRDGLAVRGLRAGDGRVAEPQEFVGWLGPFEVLQSLTAEPVDQPPPSAGGCTASPSEYKCGHGAAVTTWTRAPARPIDRARRSSPAVGPRSGGARRGRAHRGRAGDRQEPISGRGASLRPAPPGLRNAAPLCAVGSDDSRA